MITDIETLLHIAQTTRADFELGQITNDQISEAAKGAQLQWTASIIEGHGSLTFPTRYCTLASLILRNRVGYGEITIGGFNKPRSEFDEWHTFLNVGRTALGSETIVDITSDQFVGGVPVYVGPLEPPWEKVARLEKWDGFL